MKKSIGLLAAGGVLVVIVAGYLAGQQSRKDGERPAAKQEAADTDAIKKAGQSFVKAYVAGDAKSMAAHWTENGEYVAEGTTLRGRAEIQKAYEKLFAGKKAKIAAEIEI